MNNGKVFMKTEWILMKLFTCKEYCSFSVLKKDRKGQTNQKKKTLRVTVLIFLTILNSTGCKGLFQPLQHCLVYRTPNK